MIRPGHALSPAEFDALFDAFTQTAVRLETRPAYAVGGAEQERLDAFRTGRPRPLRSVRTDPWLARIALTTTTAGKSWHRYRVLDDPLTEYQRYGLASLVESQSVGEQIFLAPRADVGAAGPDFWLFDDARVVVMRYRPDGRLDSRDFHDDPATVEACRAHLAVVATAAVSLNEYLAGLRV